MSFLSAFEHLQRSPGLADIVMQARENASRRRQQDLQEREFQYRMEADKQRAADERASREFEFRKQTAAEQKARLDREEQARAAQEKSLANKQRFFAQALKANPAQADRIAAAAKTHGIELGTMVDPETMRQAQATGVEIEDATTPEVASEGLEAQASGALGAPEPPEPSRPPIDDVARAVILGQGIQYGDPRFQQAYSEEQRRQEALGVKRAKAGATTFMPGGGMGPAKPIQAEQQKELIASMQTTEMLDELEDLATVRDPQGNVVVDDKGDPVVDFGQFVGAARAKHWALSKLDEIGMLPESERAAFEKASQFRAVLDKYRSEEYKRLLGSAQSESEIRNLTNSVIAAPMGSAQFTQAFKALRRATARNERIARQVLREGFDVGSDAYRKRFSEIEKGSKGKPATTRGAPAPEPADEDLDAYFDANFGGP